MQQFLSRNWSISSKLSNLWSYSCSQYSSIIFLMSMGSILITQLSILILLNCDFSLYFVVSLARVLSILLIFSMYQCLVLLIFCDFFPLFLINLCYKLNYFFSSACLILKFLEVEFQIIDPFFFIMYVECYKLPSNHYFCCIPTVSINCIFILTQFKIFVIYLRTSLIHMLYMTHVVQKYVVQAQIRWDFLAIFLLTLF